MQAFLMRKNINNFGSYQLGSAADNGVIRISTRDNDGTTTLTTRCFIDGISGET